MLIGILSDSHGQHLAVRTALTLFDKLHIEHVIHCGDVCGEPVFNELIGRPATFVWGNMDEPNAPLLVYLESVGLHPPTQVPTRLELGQKSLAIFHGHEPSFDASLDRLEVDYILHGHTHQARNERINGKRIINPGALFRAKPRTVATLDTSTDSVEFHEINSA